MALRNVRSKSYDRLGCVPISANRIDAAWFQSMIAMDAAERVQENPFILPCR